jgi:hypothetical protein
MMELAMATEIRIKTVVLLGGKIEISTPQLVPGQQATVVVTVEDNESAGRRHVIDILRGLHGHRLFQNAEEVDAYMQKEHDAWED